MNIVKEIKRKDAETQRFAEKEMGIPHFAQRAFERRRDLSLKFLFKERSLLLSIVVCDEKCYSGSQKLDRSFCAFLVYNTLKLGVVNDQLPKTHTRF
jgi:hypothetical protein